MKVNNAESCAQSASPQKGALRELFSRDFILVAVINFFMLVAYYIVYVISAPYAIQEFAASPSQAGLVAGIIVIGCLVGRFFTGYFISSLGCRLVLLSGLLVFNASTALYLLVDSLTGLFITRFICGIGVGLIGTATGTIVAYVVPRRLHGRGVSFFSLSVALALAVGPFLGVSLIRIIDYGQLFTICLAIGCLSCLIYFFLGIPNNLVPKSQQKTRLLNLRNYVAYRVIPFGHVVMVASFCWGAVQAFVAFYAAELKMPEAASMFFLVYAITIMVSRPLSGHIYDLRGENMVIVPCLLLLAAGLWVLGSATNPGILIAASLLLGLGFGNFQSAAQAFSLSRVESARFAQATSTYFMFFDFGLGFGPYLFGFIVPFWGYAGMYKVLAVVALAALLLYALLFMRHSHGIKNAGTEAGK